MFKWLKSKFLAVMGLLLFGATGAFAEGLPAPTFNYADFYTIGGALLGALATLWVIRRALYLLGK